MKVKFNYNMLIFPLVLVIIAGGLFIYALIMGYDFYPGGEKDDYGRGYHLFPTLRQIEDESYFLPEQNKIDISHYNIALKLNTESDMIDCEVTVDGIKKGEDNIFLNFYPNYTIRKVELNGVVADYERDERHVEIDGNNISGSFTVKITYDGYPEDTGTDAFCFRKFKDRKIVYTLSEPVFASSWFPCNDLPADKATVRMIITADSSYTCLSNGLLQKVSGHDNFKTWEWYSGKPISTYLIALYAAPYLRYEKNIQSVSGDNFKLELYLYPETTINIEKNLSLHEKGIHYFEETFGPYPFPDQKYAVAEFLWNFGAMENQTITGVGSYFLNEYELYEEIFIHELAHHWWGNAVGPAEWKDVWLNEGFATYSEALWYEKEGGKKALKNFMMSKFEYFESSPLYNPSTHLFDDLVYDKGAWTLHMLGRETGDSLFFNILRNYYSKFKYKNASTAQFKNLVEEFTGKNFDKFFDQWIYDGRGIIELKYRIQKYLIERENLVEINLRQYQKGYPVYNFPLDIKFSGKDSNLIHIESVYIVSSDTLLKFKTDFLPEKIKFDPESRLLADFNKL